jgi:hypothetical protein
MIPEVRDGNETCKICVDRPLEYSKEQVNGRDRVERSGNAFKLYYVPNGLRPTGATETDIWDTDVAWNAAYTFDVACMVGRVEKKRKDKLEVNGGGGGGPKGRKPVYLGAVRLSKVAFKKLIRFSKIVSVNAKRK